MKLRQFVGLSAVVLCGWLAFTFVTEVPAKRYPKLDKQVQSDVSPQAEPEQQLAAAGVDEKSLAASPSK
jgi:hypothetical protein